MFSNIGAECAASEILALVEEIQEKYKDNPKTLEALKLIEEKTQEIITSAKAGYY